MILIKAKFFCYLVVSNMMISYIMMIILGRLLTMNMMAIMMRTMDNLCSLALYYDPINIFNSGLIFRSNKYLIIVENHCVCT